MARYDDFLNSVSSDLFKDVLEADKTILDIDAGNSKKITALDQFNAHYTGYVFYTHNIDTIKAKFFTIWEDNRYKLNKIKATLSTDIFDETHWQNKSVTTSTFEGNSLNNSEDRRIDVARSGTTDDNSQISTAEQHEHRSLLDINGDDINPHVVTQNAGDASGKSATISINKQSTQNTTATSNASEDKLSILQLRLPQLRRDFWTSFMPLFILDLNG